MAGCGDSENGVKKIYHALFVNEVEACALAGTETFEADAVLTLLHEKYPQTRLLLTAGSAGSYYLDAERRLFVPCEKVQRHPSRKSKS